MTNGVTEQATRGSWTGEVLQSQPRGSRLVKDPGSPVAVVQQTPVQTTQPNPPPVRRTTQGGQGFGPAGEASGAGSPPRGSQPEGVFRPGGGPMEAM